MKHFSRFFCAAITLWFTVADTGTLIASSASAAESPPSLATLAPVQPKIECGSLTSLDLSSAVGAPVHIDTANPVADAKPAPYCDVKGTISSTIHFEVVLPLNTWTQRFLQTGCGGFCGSVSVREENGQNCSPATNGELALAATDMGHSGGMSDASASSSPQARIDFAYRAQHLTTLTSKALIRAFYGQAPKYAYFAGCSDGGREALMEAQRFPDDFDGIIAGDPASNFISQNTYGSAWSRYVNTAADGKAILTADKLQLLHDAVLAQCDALDGAKDGLISNPLACHFNGAAIQCKPGQDDSTCLTAAQLTVVSEIYAGPHDKAGNRLAPGGLLPGSEANWAGPVIPAKGADAGVSEMAESAYKYLAFESPLPANTTSHALKFDRASFEAATALSKLYDATNPDLAAFHAHGGKLILYHGLADPAISPMNTIAYFEAVKKTMGEAQAAEFTRLYLFPGVSHCGGGQGPFNPDFLSAMMAWVETSKAPHTIVASRYPSDPKIIVGLTPEQQPRTGGAPGGGPGGQAGPGGPGGAGARPGGPPGGPGGARAPTFAKAPTEQPESTLPIFAYPETPQYTGNGSLTQASSFAAASQKPVPAAQLDWLGAANYRAGVQTWCKVVDGKLSCGSQS